MPEIICSLGECKQCDLKVRVVYNGNLHFCIKSVMEQAMKQVSRGKKGIQLIWSRIAEIQDKDEE